MCLWLSHVTRGTVTSGAQAEKNILVRCKMTLMLCPGGNWMEGCGTPAEAGFAPAVSPATTLVSPVLLTAECNVSCLLCHCLEVSWLPAGRQFIPIMSILQPTGLSFRCDLLATKAAFFNYSPSHYCRSLCHLAHVTLLPVHGAHLQ